MRPGRNTRRYRPITTAIGIVIATVNVPHGLCASACTTTSASTASRITMIIRIADHRGHACGRAHLAADHLAERPPVAPRREEQHQHVLNRAREHDADEDPQRARQVTHLRREHRPHQRPGAGDSCKVVPEQDAAFGRHVVEAVVAPPGGRRAAPSMRSACAAM